jgi:hypothetical protein
MESIEIYLITKLNLFYYINYFREGMEKGRGGKGKGDDRGKGDERGKGMGTSHRARCVPITWGCPHRAGASSSHGGVLVAWGVLIVQGVSSCRVVFESPVRSGYWVPRGSNRDRDRLAFVPRPKIT